MDAPWSTEGFVTHSDIDCVASIGEGELAPIGYYMSPGCGRDPGERE